mgnify:CR=1 FL=1
MLSLMEIYTLQIKILQVLAQETRQKLSSMPSYMGQVTRNSELSSEGIEAMGKRLKKDFSEVLQPLQALDNEWEKLLAKVGSEESTAEDGGAIVMKKALILLDDYVIQNKLEARPVANVHDEFQYEVLEEHADDFGKLAVNSIVNAGIELGIRCPLNGEYKSGNNWQETH